MNLQLLKNMVGQVRRAINLIMSDLTNQKL